MSEAGGHKRKARPLRWIVGIIAGLLLLIGVGAVVIDSRPGHRFIADRIAAIAPSTGLRIRVGRIDGSIWGGTTLRDVRLYDTRGLFFEVPQLKLDWRPIGWLANRLDIDRVAIDLAILHRLPVLRPGKPGGAILPGFDIRIGALEIRTLRVQPAVSGVARVGRLKGRADVRRGRALIDLTAASNAGDRLRLLLDTEPDRDRFDLETRLTAPAGGVIAPMLGTRRAVTVNVSGDGRWTVWDGRATATVGGYKVVDLGLGVREGSYSLAGALAPSPLLSGKLQRLSAPRILVTGSAQLEDRKLDATLSLRSPALSVDASGVLDLAASAFSGVKLNAHLLRPPALFPNMTGHDITLRATLNGPFRSAAFDYALTGKHVAFDQTGFDDVRAQGRGRFSRSPVALPVRLTARQVTGVGTVAGGILRNLSIDGVLRITAKTVTGEGMRIASDKLTGKLALLLDLVTGEYNVMISGQLTRYLIPGLGIVDVITDLKVVPGAGGRGTTVTGRGRAWVRRFDNAFLRSLAGGLPTIDTGLTRDPAGILHFSGLKLNAPAISILANGIRRRDGTFQLQGTGKQRQYGAFTLALDGDISRPKIDLLLARPADALGLSDVALKLDPDPQGFAYRAAGGSTLGPFTTDGHILLPQGQDATIAVARLDVAGTRATGALRSGANGFDGTLAVAGGGIGGTLLFAPVSTIQQIAIKLAADNATLTGAPAVTIRKGALDATVRLDPAGASVSGNLAAQGVRRGGLSIARIAASATRTGDAGTARISIAGSRGRAFELVTQAAFDRDHIRMIGQGTIDRRPIRLVTPASFTRGGDGWALGPTRLEYGGGGATLSGRFGSIVTQVDAGLDRMPLTVLDIFYPRLGLGGAVSGRLNYRLGAGTLPSGRADVTVRGLTRSGLVLSSRPVDMGIAAVLNGNAAAARAVVAGGGKAIGRAQARIAPLAGGGDLLTRLQNAPLLAQLRYNGPADTLWRLTGVEAIDLSGPIAVGADIGGRLADPQIRGSVRTDGARLESATSGTVITNLRTSGQFAGSRLTLTQFTGNAGTGTVTGQASFDLASARGFAMNVKLQAKDAVLLNRDDLAATVTGPLTIVADDGGGLISGNVALNRSRFRLGRAESATAIARLNVTEINRPADDAVIAAPAAPWRLDLKADALNRLYVTGLGLDSEWRAKLTIKGTVNAPAIAGRADLIRGNYEFAGRRFDIDRGIIRFQGESPADPTLDIAAKSSIQGLNATIAVTGTGQKPEISFTSVPALPEDELLSRLLFGTSITNLSAPEALQLAAAVASLQGKGGNGLNPINAVRRVARLDRLRILPADVTTGQRTSIAAGKYIGRRAYVEVITDGQGYSATTAEFQITRWLSLLSSISTLGRTSANLRVSKDY